MLYKSILNSLIIISVISLIAVDGIDIKSMGEGINKIIYVHVPCAWLISILYLFISLLALYYIIKKDPKMMIWIKELSLIGVISGVITLITGSIWGKYTWGTYWVWESRIVMVLIMTLLNGIILTMLIRKETSSYIKVSYLTMIGLINLPILKYSVEIWSGLHQKSDISSIDESVGIPLIIIVTILGISMRIFWIRQETSRLNQTLLTTNGYLLGYKLQTFIKRLLYTSLS
jgi:heme exporter protein C